jgi:hypothetical protein
MNYRKKYIFGFLIFYSLFCIFLYSLNFFNIGLLSDDYLNFFSAVNSDFSDKMTGNLPFTNPGHFRPLYYASLDASNYIHNLLGFQYDNFVFYRFQNLLGYFLLTFTAGWIVLHKTRNIKYAMLASAAIVLFPNNIHNICWTAGRVDLMCCLFYLLSLYLSMVYFEKKSTVKLMLASLFFVLSLMTKETSVTLPFVLLLLFIFEYGHKKIKEYLHFLIVFGAIFIIYLLYRLIFLNPGYKIFYDSDILSLFFKSFLSLSVPFDYLSLKMEILGGSIMIFAYLIFLISCIIYYLYICSGKENFRTLFFLILLTAVLLMPYVYIGYIRPQIILIPFSVLNVYIFFSFERLKKNHGGVSRKIPLALIIVLLTFWLNLTAVNVNEWFSAYNNSLKRIEHLLAENLESKKQIIIIGNAGRIKQFFMFDKLTGAYNYWKYKEFTVNDTINDIVQTAALDEVSLNSELKYKILNPGEFEISTTGSTQFFYMEGFESDKSAWVFTNKDMHVESVENKFLNKPTKIKLKILKPDVNCYLANKMNYIKIY